MGVEVLRHHMAMWISAVLHTIEIVLLAQEFVHFSLASINPTEMGWDGRGENNFGVA